MNQLNKNAQGKESKNCKKPRHAKLELKIYKWNYLQLKWFCMSGIVIPITPATIV